MAIKMVPDIGAPLTVVAADLITETWAPQWSKLVTGIMAAGGYVGAYLNFGGDYVKNIGIAALPAFAKNIYDWAMGGGASKRASRSVAFHRSPVSRWPATPPEKEFAGTRITGRRIV